MRGRYSLSVAALMLGLAGMAVPAAAQEQAPATGPSAPRHEHMRGGGQGRPQPGQMMERVREEMQKLGLSADQKTQMEKILADAKTQAEAIRDDKTLSEQDRMDKLRTTFQDLRQKLSAVLTPEQQKQFQADREQRMLNGDPIGHLQEAMKDLNLTDDQKSKVETVFADARKEFQTLKENGGGNMEAAMKLMRETRDKVNQVLTPEQSQKLTEMIQARRAAAEGAGPAGGQGDKPGPRATPRHGGKPAGAAQPGDAAH